MKILYFSLAFLFTTFSALAQNAKRELPFKHKKPSRSEIETISTTSANNPQTRIAQFGFANSANFVWGSSQWFLSDSSE